MKASISILILLIAGFTSALSQSIPTQKKENRSGRKIQVDGSVQFAGKDTVNLFLYPYYSKFRMQLDGIKYSTVTNNGKFSFKLPSIEKPYYLSFSIHSRAHRNKQNTIALFLIEPGDSIHLYITKDTIEFSGKGSKKFICQYEMQQVPEISFTRAELLKFYPDHMDGYQFNKYRELKMDSLTNLQLGILEKYRSELSTLSYERLKADYTYNELYDLYSSLNFTFHIKADSLTRKEQLRFYKDLESRNISLEEPEDILLESRSYTDFIIMKGLTEILIKKYRQHDEDLYHNSWGELFNYFESQYSGFMRDKIMAITAYTLYKRNGTENPDYFDIALSQTTEPYFKSILLKIYHLRIAGSPAYPFQLIGMDGKVVKLSDFAGKVIVMDFWFTGCTFCIDLEKQMVLVRSTFKKNRNVVFLSVCLDESKQMWLKSVPTGLYSGDGSINLFSNGKGTDDSLPKHYDILGCPKIIIIDRMQNNFSTTPVRPQDKITRKNFIKLITKAINKK